MSLSTETYKHVDPLGRGNYIYLTLVIAITDFKIGT